MCQFADNCCACAGHIREPESCAIHQAASVIGIENVSDEIGPIDYLKAELAIQKYRQGCPRG